MEVYWDAWLRPCEWASLWRRYILRCSSWIFNSYYTSCVAYNTGTTTIVSVLICYMNGRKIIIADNLLIYWPRMMGIRYMMWVFRAVKLDYFVLEMPVVIPQGNNYLIFCCNGFKSVNMVYDSKHRLDGVAILLTLRQQVSVDLIDPHSILPQLCIDRLPDFIRVSC